VRSAIVLLVFLAVGCAPKPGAPAPAEGMSNLIVTVTAEPKAGAREFAPKPVSSYDRPAPPPPKPEPGFELVPYDALGEIIVWIEPVDRRARAARRVASRVDIGSPGDAVPTYAGQVVSPVAFVSRSSQPMSVYGVSENHQFDVGEIGPQETKLVTVDRAGLYDIVDAAGIARARLMVVAAVDHALTSAGRAVTFRDLEPGTYRVIAWHPRLPGSEQRITLTANQSQPVTLNIGVNDLPKIEGGGAR
jgi:hypothetical protein